MSKYDHSTHRNDKAAKNRVTDNRPAEFRDDDAEQIAYLEQWKINHPDSDSTPLIAAIVIALVSASLLAISMYNAKAVKIAQLRGACGINCHIQEVPIYKTLGQYRRAMHRQQEMSASH